MTLLTNQFANRVLFKLLCAALLPLCALWSVGQTLTTRAAEVHSNQTAPELPSAWNGAPLRPLALSEVELRFARQFPGTVARLTDGEQVLVLRTVERPTRMLHPATDCYRGLGYRVEGEHLQAAPGQSPWRCFVVERGGHRIRVCERIEDAQGQTFTDTSAWYWAAVAGQSTGPWRAVTVARPL